MRIPGKLMKKFMENFGIPEEGFEEIPEKKYEGSPCKICGEILGKIFRAMPGEINGTMFAEIPGGIPGRISGKISERIPSKVPNGNPAAVYRVITKNN